MTASGPIKKDTIFVFGSREAFRSHTGSAPSTFVPTLRVCAGCSVHFHRDGFHEDALETGSFDLDAVRRRHKVLNYVLPLPFGQGQRFANFNGIAGKLVSGWEINGITSFQHGGYIAIMESSASVLAKNFGAGTTRSNYVPGAAGCNANRVIQGSAVSRLNKWFNTNCFA